MRKAVLFIAMSRGGNVAKAFIKIFVGVWGNAPIGFPEGENRHRPGLAVTPLL